jgi:hypothetical protein
MIKRLIAAYRLAKEAQQYVDIADGPDFWLPHNAATAASFFANETGQRLRLRLRNMVFRTAVQACGNVTNGEYERGKAHGVLLSVQAIEQHLTSAGTQPVTSELDLDEQALA